VDLRTPPLSPCAEQCIAGVRAKMEGNYLLCELELFFTIFSCELVCEI